MAKFPKVGLYTFFLVLGFCCGVLWGALSIAPYTRMKNAIADDDSYGAWEGAKKVRMFAIIGICVNVFMFLIYILANSSK